MKIPKSRDTKQRVSEKAPLSWRFLFPSGELGEMYDLSPLQKASQKEKKHSS